MARQSPPTVEALELGRAIKAARERKGLTQEDLSRALDVSTSTVQNWELGLVAAIRVRNRAKLASVLGGEAADYLPKPKALSPIEDRLAELTRRVTELELGRAARPDPESAANQDSAEPER